MAKRKPKLASDLIPTTWLDPLLTGPIAVVGQPPYNCKDIERLCSHLAERIRAFEKSEGGKP